MDNYKIIINFISVFFLCSCCEDSFKQSVNSENQREDFYRYSKDGDLYRIPLIKPFQVISSTGVGGDWIMKLPQEQIKNGKNAIEVSSLTVVDSIIIIYSELTYMSEGMTPVWLLIDTRNKRELFLQNEVDYNKSIDNLEIEKPKLYTPDELYKQFKQDGELLW